MILRQFYLSCLAQASYLIADETTRRAVIVDPQRDVEPYLAAAADAGLTISDVILTHFHADFVAGHLALRDRVGATVHLGRRASAGFAFHPLAEGDFLELGRVRLRVLETPGHTPEGISLVVEHDRVTQAVLTGDTLFIGDVGRPDLLASVGTTADELAHELYHSLAKLMSLPDATLVYPAHGAGSMCGKHLSKETVSTIGEQKAGNYALQITDEATFIAAVTADQPAAPAYFAHDVALNKHEHDTATPHATPLTISEVMTAAAAGTQIVDVRDALTFAGAHLRAAVNIGLGGQFALWAGAVLDPHKPIVLIANPGQELEAQIRLRRIGFDRVSGHLEHGMAALAAHPELITTARRIEPLELQAWLARADAPLVIDVRQLDEHLSGHIAGSSNLPLQTLTTALKDLPRTRELVVHCAGGYRSAIAASLLAAMGFTVADLIGGYGAWKAAASVITTSVLTASVLTSSAIAAPTTG